MKTIIYCLALIILLSPVEIPLRAFDTPVKMRITVFPFFSQKVSLDEADLIRRHITTGLVKSNRFNLMSDVTMAAIMQETGIAKLEECIAPTCASYYGKIFGVQFVLLGNVEKQDSLFAYRLRLINVEIGTSLYDQTTTYRDALEHFTPANVENIGRNIAATIFEDIDKYRWYHVGLAVLGLGVAFYLATKIFRLGSDNGDITSGNEKEPPPPSK